MSDVGQPPILNRSYNEETRQYQKEVLGVLSESQSDFLAMRSFSKQLLGEIKGIRTLAENLFGDRGGGAFGEEDKKFTGTLRMNSIIPRDPGSAFIAKTMWDIQEENQKQSSGLWSLLSGGLLGGGLIAGAVATLLSGLFDEGPFKGTKKLAGKIMYELGAGIIKRVIKPFKGVVDNVFKTFDKQLLTPFKSFTDRIWKQISKIGDTLLKPFRSVFDNILKFFSGLGGKIFGGLGKGPLGKAFSKVAQFVTGKIGKLAKALKFAPGIGSIVSLGFAISRFSNGDVVGGSLELAAALADAFPGIGTAISWGIDILLAARDLGAFKEGGMISGKLDVGSIFKSIWNWIKEKASALGQALVNIPPISYIAGFVEKIGKGDIGGALESMSFLATPFGMLSSILTGIPAGEEARKKLGNMLQGGGDMLKAVGGKIVELSSSLFAFIGDMGKSAIESAGNLVSVGANWVNETILQPIMGWVGNKIGSAVQTAKDIGSWVNNNIINPIGNFFSDIKKNVVRGWNAVVGDDGWVQNKLINPVFNFFESAFSAVNNAISSVSRWVQEKIIWPVRDFFGTLGSFFGVFKDMGVKDIWNMVRGKSKGVFEYAREEDQREQLKSVAREHLGQVALDTMSMEGIKKKLQEKGVYYQGISKDIQDVKDAIIKPSGQIIRTSPEDTLIATKNDVNRQSDKEITATVNNMENYDDTAIQQQNAMMINLLEKIANKEFTQETNVNNVQAEKGVNPRQLTQAMTSEVY